MRFVNRNGKLRFKSSALTFIIIINFAIKLLKLFSIKYIVCYWRLQEDITFFYLFLIIFCRILSNLLTKAFDARKMLNIHLNVYANTGSALKNKNTVIWNKMWTHLLKYIHWLIMIVSINHNIKGFVFKFIFLV